MAPSPQWTVRSKQLLYITLIYLPRGLHREPKGVIVQYIYRIDDSLVSRGPAVSGPIDVHSLQAQKNICFAMTARAADVPAGLNQLSPQDDKKRVKLLQWGHQNGALTRLSPLLKCHFYNHAATVYCEIKHTHGLTTLDRMVIRT